MYCLTVLSDVFQMAFLTFQGFMRACSAGCRFVWDDGGATNLYYFEVMTNVRK